MDKRQTSSKENYNLLMAKKTEKIVTAVYLISQFLSKEENLKHDLRKEANQLLKNINAIAYIDSNNEDDSKNVFVIYKICLDNVSLLISYLYVARNANLISKMNADIVIEGLRILENILIKKQFSFSKENVSIQEDNLLSGFFVGNDFESDKNISNTSFDSLTERNVEANNKNKTFSLEKITEVEIKRIPEKVEEKKIEQVNSKTDISKGQSIKDINPKRHNTSEAIKNIVNKNKSPKSINRKANRKDQIISLFIKGVEVSINDISKKVIGCSTKTLQRELNNLVQENKIKRIGDKRWSKYVLV